VVGNNVLGTIWVGADTGLVTVETGGVNLRSNILTLWDSFLGLLSESEFTDFILANNAFWFCEDTVLSLEDNLSGVLLDSSTPFVSLGVGVDEDFSPAELVRYAEVLGITEFGFLNTILGFVEPPEEDPTDGVFWKLKVTGVLGLDERDASDELYPLSNRFGGVAGAVDVVFSIPFPFSTSLDGLALTKGLSNLVVNGDEFSGLVIVELGLSPFRVLGLYELHNPGEGHLIGDFKFKLCGVDSIS